MYCKRVLLCACNLCTTDNICLSQETEQKLGKNETKCARKLFVQRYTQQTGDPATTPPTVKKNKKQKNNNNKNRQHLALLTMALIWNLKRSIVHQSSARILIGLGKERNRNKWHKEMMKSLLRQMVKTIASTKQLNSFDSVATATPTCHYILLPIESR